MERHGGRMREREATEIDPLREKREAKRDNKQNRTEQNRTPPGTTQNEDDPG